MRILKNPLMKLTLVALVVGLANPALAEWKSSYDSQGNNVGMHFFSTGTGGPCGGSHQFPKGSGNIISFSPGMSWGVQVARDMDGDGTAEDTNANRSRGRQFYGINNSLESYDVLEALFLAGENMSNAASRIENNRIWSSLDADDLPEWPTEFREGRSTSGQPILSGAETVVVLNGDCFKSGGDGVGASLEYRFHFLNFAESNNMVYGHCFIRNMSEYLKWGPHPGIMDKVAATPNGQTWMGLQFTYAMVYAYIGVRDEGFAFYAPKGINAVVDTDGQEDTFSGPIPMFGHMMLKAPSHNGETMTLTGFNSNHSGGFGFTPTIDILAGSWTNEQGYRYGLGRNAESVLQGYINPWNGKPMYGWPGILEPEDERYNQWTWTPRSARNHYVFWSELHDFGPRDSTSCDFVMMFAYPKNPPLVMKVAEWANMDDQETQDQLSPFLDYATVAQIVFDGGFILPETPAPPPLTIIPGSRQVTITWSDVNVHTADSYYSFLQDHDLDPENLYKEYDFEGYRLFRSFVAGSDSHSEMIFECSKSAGNISYYFIDKYGDDIPFRRLSNGQKVWYALVPFDINVDPSTGEAFSLPGEESGKVWNRAGVRLYTVLPRSDASNFRPSQLVGMSYIPTGTVTPSSLETVELSGADGVLTEAPVYLEPQATLDFETVNPERITSDVVAFIKCIDMAPHGDRAGKRLFGLVDASGNVIQESSDYIIVRHYGDYGHTGPIAFFSGLGEDGVAYKVSADDFENRYRYIHGLSGTVPAHAQIDDGGYTGADIDLVYRRYGLGRFGGKVHTTNDLWQGCLRSGKYTVTWSNSGGSVSVSVNDAVRGMDIPFSAYVDEEGWGLVPPGTTPGDYQEEFGVVSEEGPYNVEIPQSERTSMLVETLPAANTETFFLYVNGRFIRFAKEDENGDPLPIEMPGNGTTMVITSAFGQWNGDEDVFTQVPDPVWIGDSWKFEATATTMNPEDADLTKIRVVPNPYFATSFLDLSSNNRRIEFVNLPDRCTIRIYTLSGNLVNVLNHIGANRHGWGNYTDWDRLDVNSQPKELTGYDNHGGSEPWGLRNRFGQTVASGLYFFHVTDIRGETHTGRFYIVN